jgi:hypothetical protein
MGGNREGKRVTESKARHREALLLLLQQMVLGVGMLELKISAGHIGIMSKKLHGFLSLWCFEQQC